MHEARRLTTDFVSLVRGEVGNGEVGSGETVAVGALLRCLIAVVEMAGVIGRGGVEGWGWLGGQASFVRV